jgi:hypothetical protein
MIQFALYILQVIAIGIFLILTIVFAILATVKRKNKKSTVVFALLFTASLIATIFIWRIDLFNAESENREETIAAFESNFGFKPPNSVKEIKVKNVGIHDSDIHWMAFTYDAAVLNKILSHDRPLQIAQKRTPKYDEILETLKNGCANCPGWLEFPDEKTNKIYFKTDFLDHASSEYYLWVNPIEKMVYLEVSYLD